MQKEMSCHICNSDKVEFALKVKGFDIYRCGDCLTQFVHPMPESSVICGEDNLSNPYYGWLTFWRQARIIKSILNEGKILDFGCGGGHFLSHMGSNWKKYGIDRSEEACEVAREKGIRVLPTLDVAYKKDWFDVITMFAVIEHLPNPKEVVGQLVKMLKPNGLFAVMTGDVESPKAKAKGNKWHMYCPPLHLYFFSAKAVDLLMSSFGLVKVKSLYTDGGMMKIPFVDVAYPILKGLPLFDHYYSYWRKQNNGK